LSAARLEKADVAVELTNDLSSGLPDTRRGLPLLPRGERLDAFSLVTRYFLPGYQDAVDRLVNRLKQHDAGEGAPKPGELMPGFVLPDEQGHIVTAPPDRLR
jgi:hypothetical protein